jgi:hypothetical protein
MPSEQSPPNNSSPARNRSSEKAQHSPITGGVRGLLGLPMRANGVLSTTPLTAPPRGHHYGQPPLPASEENDEGFRDGAQDEGLSEEGGSTGADPQSNFPHALRHHGTALPRAVPENPADTRSTATTRPAEQREQTSFVIPGVSTRRTAFAALSHTSDTTKVTQQEEPRETSPDKVAPLHASVLLPHPRESETQHTSVMTRSPRPVEPMGIANGERGDTDVARRLTQLQRTVNELAATVSAQAAQMRDERQAQERERQTPPQRMVVVQRGAASSTTPRAFWERSRLGRLHLRIGR